MRFERPASPRPLAWLAVALAGCGLSHTIEGVSRVERIAILADCRAKAFVFEARVRQRCSEYHERTGSV